MAVPDTSVLPGDTSVPGRELRPGRNLGEGLARCSALCCNRSGLRCNENLLRGFTTSRRETDTGGRIRGHFAAILLDRTESASPPRAEPCARAPLSPPVAPASYFCGPRRACRQAARGGSQLALISS